jgi:hypothetical protein
MRPKTAILLILVTILSLGIISGARAATTPIHIDTEGFGEVIQENTGDTNHIGEMFWNGNVWVVNPTGAHQYFTDLRTGNRLKEYVNNLDVSVSNSEADSTSHSDGYGKSFPSQTLENYTVTKQVFYYTKACDPQKQTGNYQYGGVEYRITDSATGKMVILVSRGSGSGLTTNAFFDVYIEDPRDDSTKATTAFLNDPIWYHFPTDAVSALSKSDISSYRVGSLSGAANQSNLGDFYLDINGGSDMGGVSYELHTAPLSTKFSETSSSYITSFELKFTNSQGNLAKIIVRPTLISEVSNATANPSPSVPEFPVWVVLPLLVAVPFALAICLKKQQMSKTHQAF